MAQILTGLTACPQATDSTMDPSTIWVTTETGGVRPPMEEMPSSGTSTQETPV